LVTPELRERIIELCSPDLLVWNALT
jgi:hypothetical protein